MRTLMIGLFLFYDNKRSLIYNLLAAQLIGSREMLARRSAYTGLHAHSGSDHLVFSVTIAVFKKNKKNKKRFPQSI